MSPKSRKRVCVVCVFVAASLPLQAWLLVNPIQNSICCSPGADDADSDVNRVESEFYNPLCPECPQCPPLGLEAFPQDHSARLTWHANLDAWSTHYYIVYRCREGGEWKRVDEVPAPDTTAYLEYTCTDTGLANGVSYTYCVKAANYLPCPICSPWSGGVIPTEHTSPSSNRVTVTPMGPCTEPLNLEGMYSETGGWWTPGPVVILTWSPPEDDGSENDDGSSLISYNVYKRNVTDTSGVKVATVPASQCGYGDLDLKEYSSYVYQVSAVNARAEGPLSDEFQIWIPKLPPPPPPPSPTDIKPFGDAGVERRAVENSEVEVEFGIQNLGEVDAEAFSYGVYIINYPYERPTEDRLIAEYDVEGLAGTTSISLAHTVLLPSGITGTYYIGAIADIHNDVLESNEDNNVACLDILHISPVGLDLVANSVFLPSEVPLGDGLRVQASFSNTGCDDLVGCWARILMSPDSQVTLSDKAVGGYWISLGPGETVERTTIIRPVLEGGTYYCGVIIDSMDDLIESDESNNVATSTSAIELTSRPAPDLAALSIDGPSYVAEGENATVHVSIGNVGEGNAVNPRFSVLLLMESDGWLYNVTVLHSEERLIRLPTGSIYEENITVKIPESLIGHDLVWDDESYDIEIASPFRYGLSIYTQNDLSLGSMFPTFPSSYLNDFVISSNEVTVNISEVALPPDVPPPPVDFTATFEIPLTMSNPYQVFAEWSNPFGVGNDGEWSDELGSWPISHYRVYAEDSSGNIEVLDECRQFERYTIIAPSQLKPGEIYSLYVVSVVKVIGFDLAVSPRSNIAVIEVPDAPSEPFGIAVISANGEAYIEWAPPFDDGGSQIIGYRIYRGESPDVMDMILEIGADNCMTDASIASETNYYYAVSAYNLVMEGRVSEIAMFDGESPLANAGPDESGSVGEPIIFDGSMSTDNVGIVAYSWSLVVDDEPVTLDGASVSYAFLSPGEYSVTLTVIDAFGNMDSDEITVTVLDGECPATEISISGLIGNDNWYVSLISVELDAVDEWSPIDYTQYRLNSSIWQTYSGPFDVSTDGIHTIEFFSVDSEGNSEPVQSVQVGIDTTCPVLSVQAENGTVFTTANVNISLTCSDSCSGVDCVEYSLDNGVFVVCDSEMCIQLSNLSDGAHKLSIRIHDQAGNEVTQELTFEVSVVTDDDGADEDEKSFIESYGLPLGIIIALTVVALVLFLILKGREGGTAPSSVEEKPAGKSEAHG